MANYEGYCVKCREKREFDGQEVELANGRRAAQGLVPDLRHQNEPHSGQEKGLSRASQVAPGRSPRLQRSLSTADCIHYGGA